MTALLVALGGGIGAVLRFVLDAEIKRRARLTWPVATWFINVVGSFALGLTSGAGLDAAWLAFVGTGICGGLTTFSTASVETVTLVRERHGVLAVVYALGSVLACCLAYAAGSGI